MIYLFIILSGCTDYTLAGAPPPAHTPTSDAELYAEEIEVWHRARERYCQLPAPSDEHYLTQGQCLEDWAEDCLSWSLANDPADCAYMDVDCMPPMATRECR